MLGTWYGPVEIWKMSN